MSERPEGSSGIDYLVSLGGFTAIGVLIYAILRFAYWSFYNRFGVTPEEVASATSRSSRAPRPCSSWA
jgi:hypothetical protein